MNIVEFKKYQDAARTTRMPGTKNSLVYSTLGLAGEAGEIANKVKKLERGDSDREAIIEGIKSEMGDVLWYLAAMADDLGVSLEEVAAMNIDKLQKRYTAGSIKGTGDNR